MLQTRVLPFFVAAALLGAACCATAQTIDRARIVDLPLASTHADMIFSLTTGSRQSVSCDGNANCAMPSDGDSATRFAQQVQRVSDTLEKGVQALYPDLAQNVPGLVSSHFDVYVVDDDEPGSTSSANGRIALSAALGTWQPYDDWLAFVIAREMGHVIARHHEENSIASIATSIIMNFAIPGSALLKSVISAGGSRIASISKRSVQAQEADAIAFSLLRSSGFQLHDVSLSLRVATLALDESPWATSFRTSSENLLGEVRNSALAVAYR